MNFFPPHHSNWRSSPRGDSGGTPVPPPPDPPSSTTSPRRRRLTSSGEARRRLAAAGVAPVRLLPASAWRSPPSSGDAPLAGAPFRVSPGASRGGCTRPRRLSAGCAGRRPRPCRRLDLRPGASPCSICAAGAPPGRSPASPSRMGSQLAAFARPLPVYGQIRRVQVGPTTRPSAVVGLLLVALLHQIWRVRMASSTSTGSPCSLVAASRWPRCTSASPCSACGGLVEEALPGENFIDNDGCSRHFPFLKVSSLALFPSPQALRSREKSQTRGSPCRMVSTSLRRFLFGGIFLDFFCFGWTRLLLLHLHLGFDPGLPLFLATRVELAWTSWGGLDDTLPFDLGGSTPVLRLSVSVACCLLGFAGGTPVPPLELGYPTLFIRASDASQYASTSVSPFRQGCASWWPGRRSHGHPGVASAARCPSTSAAVHWCRALRSRWCVVFWLRRRTPVSPHELGYPTPFVRASDVPLRVVGLVPVCFSLGLAVVLCQGWNKLLSGACYARCRPPGVSVWFCCQPSPPFCFFLLVLGFLLPSPVIFFYAFVRLRVSVLTAKSPSSWNITSGGVFCPPPQSQKKKS